MKARRVLAARLVLVLLAALAAAALAGQTVRPHVVEAAHLVTVASVEAQPGEKFASTTAKYWAGDDGKPVVPPKLRVYRRGDSFETTTKLAVAPDWSLVSASLKLEIAGPANFTFPYDAATCTLDYGVGKTSVCFSIQNTVEFVKFDDIDKVSPVLKVTWKRPDATNKPVTTEVPVGRYRLIATLTDANLDASYASAVDCVDPGDPCTGKLEPLYVIFNPYKNSGDSHVTGLPNKDLAFFAIGDDDYFYNPNANPVQVRNVLLPAKRAVFLEVIDLIDANATKSAKRAVELITSQVSSQAFLEGRWPAGKHLIQRDVPMILKRRTDPEVCGNCQTFGALATAFDRAMGIPARMATASPSNVGGGAPPWDNHVWTEVWLNEVTPAIPNNFDTWSAHDATKGIRSWGSANRATRVWILPAGPAKRSDPSFTVRVQPVQLKPPPAPKTNPIVTATKGNVNRTPENVTPAYLPPPPAMPAPPPGMVRILPVAPVSFGSFIVVDVEYTNPQATDQSADIGLVLTADFLESLYVRTDNLVFDQFETAVIPAGGHITRSYYISPGAYVYSGTFAAQATIVLDNAEENDQATVDVATHLGIAVSGPAELTPGESATIHMTITNLANQPFDDVLVDAWIPEELQPDATEFALDLAPGEERSLEVHIFPTEATVRIIGVQAYSPEAGLALEALSVGEPEAVGGSTELLVGGDAPASAAGGGDDAPYAAIAGGAAVLLAMAGGGWFVRRRWMRKRAA